MAERKTFDYHFKDFRPEIKWWDLIPVVGLVTCAERVRKERCLSRTDFYLKLGKPTKKDVILFGTANWPKGTDRAADMRSSIMALRNAAFTAYHPLIVAEVLRQVFIRIPPTG